MTPVNWSNHTIEYEEAADLLLDNMIRTQRQNLVFPTIFLYRHYIELMLKEIVLNNWTYLHLSGKGSKDLNGQKLVHRRFPSGHDIYKLWKMCREALQETDKLVDSQFAESQEYIKEIIQTYDALEADLNKFAKIDPDSEHFRYPVDTEGKPIVIDKRLLTELLGELPELVKRISYNLNGISVGIYTILQNKYDALAQ